MTETTNTAGAAGTERTVELARTGPATFRAVNVRGGELSIGSGEDADFTPVELLLAAIAGCSAIDVDLITGKRAEPESFTVRARGDKVRDEQGNHLTDLRLGFDVRFAEGEAGDAARAVLQRSIEQSRDRLCTVSRTVAIGTPVAMGRVDAEGTAGPTG